MDYLKHYNLLMSKAQNRILDEYVESHHIIPRCMGGTDDINNLVDLTPEEHYLAHQLLVKMYPEHTGLAFAANMMCTNRPSNKVYGWIRRRISHNMKGDNNPMRKYPDKNNFNRNGKDHPAYGRRLTEQQKQLLSEAKLGDKNPNYGIKPWKHSMANAKTVGMWKRANEYYDWWCVHGPNGHNPMARAFNEKYCGTHGTMIKYFKTLFPGFNSSELLP